MVGDTGMAEGFFERSMMGGAEGKESVCNGNDKKVPI